MYHKTKPNQTMSILISLRIYVKISSNEKTQVRVVIIIEKITVIATKENVY